MLDLFDRMIHVSGDSAFDEDAQGASRGWARKKRTISSEAFGP